MSFPRPIVLPLAFTLAACLAPPARALSANGDPELQQRIARQALDAEARKLVEEAEREGKGGAERALRRLVRERGRDALPYVNELARRLAEASGQDPVALRILLWKEFLRAYSDASEAQKELGQAGLEAEDYITAIVALSRALELGETAPGIYYQRGMAAERLGDSEQAHEDARRVLSADPENAEALSLYKLTEARLSKVKVDLATGELEPAAGAAPAVALERGPAPDRAAGEPPRTPAAADPVRQSAQLTATAQRHLRLGDARAAVAAAAAATRLNPANAQAFNLLATAHERAGNHEAAAAAADEALRLQPDSVPALNTRAWASSGLKLFRKALGDAEAALKLDPFNAFGFVNKARALGGLGLREQMIQALRQSAGLDARFEDLHRRALTLPSAADTELLFAGLMEGRLEAAPAPRAPSKLRRFLTLMALCALGGLLIALGLLHLLVPEWRTTMGSTLRRLRRAGRLAGRPPSGAAADAALAGYEIKRVIATGGMGVVYEAVDRVLERRVAVKKLRGEIRDDPKERARFLKEARTVANLSHPHIVQIHAVIEEGPDLYLVFEFVEGRTLRELLAARRALPWREALTVFRGVCKALDHAHRHEVVHRDLKPSNIMVDREGRALVMDFGVARAVKDALGRAAVTNTVWGTPSYMAPEAEEGEVRAQSDIYSLGVLLYEAVTGKLPFHGSPGAMYKAKAAADYAPPSKLDPKLPPGLDAALARALDPKPERRYRDIREFYDAVKEIA